tara:strand:- start:8434 stop:9090 length:657 start_codon:yes stop_codon:yes gene_type:complete
MGAKVEVNVAQILNAMTGMKKAVKKGLRAGSKNIGASIVREAKKDVPRKTRTLSRSIKAKVYTQPGGDSFVVVAGIGTATGGEPLAYARIQDIGGVVRAKKAKKLAIPVHRKLKTKAGVGGITARMVIQNPKQFGFESTFTTPNAILGRKIGAQGKFKSGPRKGQQKGIEVLFARKESVYIQPTRYLSDPFERMKRGDAQKILAAAVNRELAKAGQGQ